MKYYPACKELSNYSGNSTFSGLEILFQIFSSSNYGEVQVDIKMYNPQKWLLSVFSPIKQKFWAGKRNVSMRRFFYAPKTYVNRQLLN